MRSAVVAYLAKARRWARGRWPCSRPPIAKMRVFRVPIFLVLRLMLGLLGVLLLFRFAGDVMVVARTKTLQTLPLPLREGVGGGVWCQGSHRRFFAHRPLPQPPPSRGGEEFRLRSGLVLHPSRRHARGNGHD